MINPADLELQQEVPSANQVSQQSESLGQELYQAARARFVSKVYTILGMELLITSVFVMITFSHPEYAEFQRQHRSLSVLSFLITLAAMATLLCSKDLSQRFPANMILLGIFTIAQSYSVSAVCAQYDHASVMLAAGVTAAATIGLCLYVKLSGSDLSSLRQMLGGMGSSLALSIMLISCVSFVVDVPIGSRLMALGLAVVHPLYLIYDTQMMLDNTKHRLSLDEFVMASMFLYVDIVGIFLDILRLMGSRRTT